MDTKFAKSAYRHFLFWGVCTSLAITVCTIVDALLVGNLVGSNGLAVTNLSTPVFLTYALFGVTIGVGANVRIGKHLGASEIEEANRVFQSQLTTGLAIGLFCWVTLLFRGPFFSALGVTETLRPLAERYLTVVLAAAPIFVMYHILSASVRTDSDPALASLASGVVIVTNLGLDLFFMLVLRWGIFGASASLCVAETLGVAVLLSHFFKKRALLKLRLRLPAWEDVKNFVVNGFGMGSAFFFQGVVMLAFNTMLIRTGGAQAELNVAVYGVLYSISMVPFALFDGASNALATIISFFLGESDAQSIRTVYRQALCFAVISSAVIIAICQLFAGSLAALFGLPPEVSEGMAALAIRVFSLSILLSGVNTVITAYWQAIGRAGLASFISLLRNFAVMLLFGFYPISHYQILGVSVTYGATELLCTVLLFVLLSLPRSRGYLDEICAITGRVFESQYTISTESHEQISGDLERICEEWGLAMGKTFFIQFICEELLLNIIKFGLKDGQSDRYIAIKLMEREGEYVLRIRDNVREFNPFEVDGDEIDNGVLTLIKKKTKQYDYQRKMIFNYLYMVL